MSARTDASHREQAALWYEEQARQIGPCALASTWKKFADRIRNGDADSRIMDVIASQADYDAEPRLGKLVVCSNAVDGGA